MRKITMILLFMVYFISPQSRAEVISYDKCVTDNIPLSECSLASYTAQDKRLNTAYKVAIEYNNGLKDEQRAWIKSRDKSCVKPSEDNETYHLLDMYYSCLFEATEKRSIELEKLSIPIVSSESSPMTDINTIAGNMYVAYYNGGITAMINSENECWSRLKTTDYNIAGECYITAISGSTVEVAYANNQGRVIAPFYQPATMNYRAEKNMEKVGINIRDLKDKAPYFVHENMLHEISIGLFNAGMQ